MSKPDLRDRHLTSGWKAEKQQAGAFEAANRGHFSSALNKGVHIPVAALAPAMPRGD